MCREEVFGPVVTVTPFDNEDEAVGLANDTPYGLNAMLFTENVRRAHRVAGRLRAGTVWVNCFFVRDLRAPFGGDGRLGHRPGGRRLLPGVLHRTQGCRHGAVAVMAPLPFDGLLLDVGAVVVRTPFEMHRVAEARYGLDPGTLSWMGPHDPSSDPLWRNMQAGQLSELDYWHRRAEETERRAGRHGGLQDYMRMCFGGPQSEFVRPEAEALVADARAAGMRIGVLTNETELMQGRAWIERVDVFRSVDALVDASITGIMKPDPAAYELALDALEAIGRPGVVRR